MRRGTRRVHEAIRSYPPTIRFLFLGEALTSTANGALFGFLAIYVATRFHVDVLVAATASTLYFLGAALGSPVAGWLAERHGRRRVIIGSLLLGAVSAAALGMAPDLGSMMAASAAAGLFGSAGYPAIQAMVADTVPDERRDMVYGAMYQALGLGWFLGPALAGALLGAFGFPPVFLAGTAILLATTALFWWRLPETLPAAARGGARPGGVARAGDVSRDGGVPGAAAVPAPARVRPWYRDRRLMAYVGLHLVTFGAYIQLFTVFPVEGLERNGLSREAWAAILALNGAMILAGQNLVSRLVSGRHRPYVVAGGVLLWSVGFAALALVGGGLPVVLAVALMTVGEMIVFPLQSAVVADLAPEAARAQYQAALSTAGSFGNAAAPVLAGAAVLAIGRAWWLALAGVLVALAGAYVAFGRLVRRRGRAGMTADACEEAPVRA